MIPAVTALTGFGSGKTALRFSHDFSMPNGGRGKQVSHQPLILGGIGSFLPGLERRPTDLFLPSVPGWLGMQA